jgi:pyruvate dehydrogenase (quinone)
MGRVYQQEVDLVSLYKDVPGEYCEMVMVPEQLPNVLDRALRIAAGRRTVTAVIIPSDVQDLDRSAPGAFLQDGAIQPRPQLVRAGPPTTN